MDGESVDYGYVGDIVSIDTTVLRKQLDAGLMPVVSPLSADDSGCDAAALLRSVLAPAGGKGGGTPRLAQGTLPADALENAAAQLSALLGANLADVVVEHMQLAVGRMQ